MYTKLVELPYSYDALEPHIDARTMEIHHSRHHNTYVTKLNEAMESFPDLHGKSLDQLLAELDQLPEGLKTAVRNHGGGTWNHNLFWETMSPLGGGEAKGKIKDLVEQKFGNFLSLKEKLSSAAVSQFGSGWGWLVLAKSGDLEVVSTPNQDNPLSDGHLPLLAVDVWEHAYYLKYQNKRPDYVEAWWNLVNWDAVEELYRAGA